MKAQVTGSGTQEGRGVGRGSGRDFHTGWARWVRWPLPDAVSGDSYHLWLAGEEVLETQSREGPGLEGTPAQQGHIAPALREPPAWWGDPAPTLRGFLGKSSCLFSLPFTASLF